MKSRPTLPFCDSVTEGDDSSRRPAGTEKRPPASTAGMPRAAPYLDRFIHFGIPRHPPAGLREPPARPHHGPEGRGPEEQRARGRARRRAAPGEPLWPSRSASSPAGRTGGGQESAAGRPRPSPTPPLSPGAAAAAAVREPTPPPPPGSQTSPALRAGQPRRAAQPAAELSLPPHSTREAAPSPPLALRSHRRILGSSAEAARRFTGGRRTALRARRSRESP